MDELTCFEEADTMEVESSACPVECNKKLVHWTEHEEETLRELYGSMPAYRVQKLLPRFRAVSAIKGKAKRLGLTRKYYKKRKGQGKVSYFTDWEVSLLIELGPILSIADLRILLKTKRCREIYDKAEDLGIQLRE